MCNQEVKCTFFETPIGKLSALYCDRGLHSLALDDAVSDETFSVDPKKTVLALQDSSLTEVARLVFDWLEQYFGKKESNIVTIPICVFQSDKLSFTENCWQILHSNVHFGQAVSYGELAKMCGNERASRAVGHAMKMNPLILIVPCHRVLPVDGSSGQYCGGKRNSVKKWLLNFEKS